MEKVTISSCKYLYINLDNMYILQYDPKDDWAEEFKGQTAMQLTDTGNGIEFNQIKKGELDYSEVAELRYLLNKIKGI